MTLYFPPMTKDFNFLRDFTKHGGFPKSGSLSTIMGTDEICMQQFCHGRKSWQSAKRVLRFIPSCLHRGRFRSFDSHREITELFLELLNKERRRGSGTQSNTLSSVRILFVYCLFYNGIV